jgi:hypothetical protein
MAPAAGCCFRWVPAGASGVRQFFRFKRSGEPQSGDVRIEIHLGFALFLVRRWIREEVRLWMEGSQPERRPRLGEEGRIGEVNVAARDALLRGGGDAFAERYMPGC